MQELTQPTSAALNSPSMKQSTSNSPLMISCQKGSFMIDGVLIKPLVAHADDRGCFIELLRNDEPAFTGFGQSAATWSHPGVIKAFHWHRHQDDFWTVLAGMAQVVLFDLREGSATYEATQVVYMGEQKLQGLLIPRGVAHGYRVLGAQPLLLVYHVTKPYNPRDPDEERLPYDCSRIGFDWETRSR